jgi:hypothetical protein
MAGRRVSLLGTLASLPAANLKVRSQGSVFLSKDGVVGMGYAVAFTGKTQKIALQARDSRGLRKLDAVRGIGGLGVSPSRRCPRKIGALLFFPFDQHS